MVLLLHLATSATCSPWVGFMEQRRLKLQTQPQSQSHLVPQTGASQPCSQADSWQGSSHSRTELRMAWAAHALNF